MKTHQNLGPSHPTFGSVMEGRSFVGDTSAWYRFGYGGQEKDDEISGEGNLYSAEFWEYDARVGRRWNVDPMIKPWESGYATFHNNPLFFTDPLGLDPPEKNFFKRMGNGIKNWVKGDAYKNKANREALKLERKGYQGIDIKYKTNEQGRDYADITSIKYEKGTSKAGEDDYDLGGFTRSQQRVWDGGGIQKAATINGYLTLSASAVENLGGLEKAKELVSNGKFETNYRGKTRQWSVKFYGNKSVPATFVSAEKSAFFTKATQNATALKIVKASGVVFNVAGLGFTGYDMLNNGIDTKNSTEAFFGFYSFIPGYGWIVSGSYFVIDQTIGWENAVKSYIQTTREFQESTGERLVPLMFKY